MIKGKIKAAKPANAPRISVNKLAEYLEANPSRRKKIVFDSKFPESYVTTRYKDARETAKAYLSGALDEDGVLKAISRFEKEAIAAAKIPDNEFQIQDKNLSAEVLGYLLETELPDLSSSEIMPFAGPNKKMLIRGVAVSVNPDLVIQKELAGIVNVGVAKLHFIKTFQLSDESQKIVSVILHEYARKYIVNHSNNEAVSNKLCLSVDIFKQQYVVCPTAIKMRMKRVEDACEEIALRWHSL